MPTERVYMTAKGGVVPADDPDAYSWIEQETDERGMLIKESWGFTEKAEKEFTEKARKGRKERKEEEESTTSIEYWPRKSI